MPRGSLELPVRPPWESLLDRPEPELELVESPLQADHVCLAEHRRLHGVLGVVDERRDREAKRRSVSQAADTRRPTDREAARARREDGYR